MQTDSPSMRRTAAPPPTVELPVLTLRVNPEPPAPAAAPPPPLPGIELIRSDPDPVLPVLDDAASPLGRPADAPAGRRQSIGTPLPPQTSGDARAARRALVRRRVLAATAHPASDAPEATRLLLLEPDDRTRAAIAELLEGFGFAVYAAHDIPQVEALLAVGHFAAALLDVALDDRLDSASALLCQRVKLQPADRSGRRPGLIVITDRARPANQVRARLAGADCVLVKPSSRGDLVRALADAGVALPHDPRHRA